MMLYNIFNENKDPYRKINSVKASTNYFSGQRKRWFANNNYFDQLIWMRHKPIVNRDGCRLGPSRARAPSKWNKNIGIHMWGFVCDPSKWWEPALKNFKFEIKSLISLKVCTLGLLKSFSLNVTHIVLRLFLCFPKITNTWILFVPKFFIYYSF